MTKRFGVLLIVLFALVAFVYFLKLPSYLPFVSPVDQALRKVAKSGEPKTRLAALLELQEIVKEGAITPLQREQVIKSLLEIAASDPDERVRGGALRLLLILWGKGQGTGDKGQLMGKKMQEVLIQALSRSPQEAALAVEVLPQIADEGTWRMLMDAFESEKDPTVRDRLSRILCQMPTTVWQDFCSRLGKEPQKWQTIADKLPSPPTSFRSTLVQWALNGDMNLRKGALMLLARFPPSPQESERLKPLANSQDKTVRALVFGIWAQSPSKALVQELRRGLADEPNIAYFASAALLKLGELRPEEGRKLLAQPYAPLRAQGALALMPSRLKEDWLALIRALKDPDPEVIRNATIALVAKGPSGLSVVLGVYEKEKSPEKRAAMLAGMSGVSHPKVIAALVRALRFGDWRERGVALAGLSFHKDSALPMLKQLAQSSDKRDRLAVIEALNAINTPNALKLLLQMARSEPDEQIRCEALLALSNYGVKEAIPLLADLVQKGEPTTASTAAIGLTRYGEEGRKVLRRLLNSERRETRLAAAKALATLNDPAAIETLKQQANTADIPQRITVLQLMARAGDEKALRELIGFLSHDEPVVRLRARLSIYAVGKQAIPLLIQTLDSPDNKLRAESALILGALNADVAREKLASLLKDPDPQVREAAQMALSRLEEPSK
jgi:HEAT repeat protein